MAKMKKMGPTAIPGKKPKNMPKKAGGNQPIAKGKGKMKGKMSKDCSY